MVSMAARGRSTKKPRKTPAHKRANRSKLEQAISRLGDRLTASNRELRGEITQVGDRLTESNRELRVEITHVRSEIGQLRNEFVESRRMTEVRFESLESAVNGGFETLGRRIDGLRDLSGSGYRDHEDRIRRLEKHTGLPPGGTSSSEDH